MGGVEEDFDDRASLFRVVKRVSVLGFVIGKFVVWPSEELEISIVCCHERLGWG